MSLAIVIPAAGASSRMDGEDKLMQLVDGQPLLARQAARALATAAPVFVTTRSDRPARIAALAGLGVQMVAVPHPDEGLAASLRAGVAALPESTTGIMVLLPDLPDLDAQDLRAMMRAHDAAPDAILRATAQDGRTGHPTVFPGRHRAALMQLAGDTGAQGLLNREGFTPVALPDQRAVTDLDTPADWAAWRATRG